MLQEDMDLALAEERADALHFFPVHHVEQLRAAKLFEDIRELQLAQQRIAGIAGAVAVGCQRDDEEISVPVSKQLADFPLHARIPDEDDGLIHVMESDSLVGILLEEVALAHLAALALDALGQRAVRDQVKNIGLFGGDIAQQMEQQIIFADR